MPAKIPPPPKEDLERMYIDEQMIIKDIAEHYGTTKTTTRRWIKYYQIPIRSIREAKLLEHGNSRPPKEELERIYHEEQMSLRQIGEKYGVSDFTIGRWMKEEEIELRHKEVDSPPREELDRLYNEQGLSKTQIAKHYGVGPTCVLNWLKDYNISRRDRNKALLLFYGKKEVPKSDLQRMYVDEQMSITAIAEITGLGRKTISRLIKEYDIQKRSLSEAALLARGKTHPPKEELEKFRKEGLSFNEIGKIYNVCHTTARKWLQEADLLEDKPSKSQQLEDLLTEYIGEE